VYVRKNALFLGGMEFEVERSAGTSWFDWEYRGRLPRLRGRW
jgi:hypothetical protein